MTLPELLPIMAEPLRLRILNLLASSPLCVQHLQKALASDQVSASKHLLILKAEGLVTSEKIRFWRLYRLSPNPSRTFRRLLECVQTAIREEGLYAEDMARLGRLRSQIAPFLHGKKERGPITTKTSLPEPTPHVPSEFSGPMEDHLL